MTAASVLILTLNEEVNIADCIDSCVWSDDIVVFDSMSCDRTQQLARAKGARVFERGFDDYAAQRNAALSTISFKYPWVLMVDADERVPEDLAAEIATAVRGAADDVAMFRVRRKDFFLGRWLRRSSGYPTWFGRLVRPERTRVERQINEEYVTDGRIEPLLAHLHHYPFNKGLNFWFDRHNRYSSMEAAEQIARREESTTLAALLSAEPMLRRRARKQLAYRLPLRPGLVFLYLYVFRLGMLDGRAGWCFSRMRATYELMIDLKTAELRRRQRGLPV